MTVFVGQLVASKLPPSIQPNGTIKPTETDNLNVLHY